MTKEQRAIRRKWAAKVERAWRAMSAEELSARVEAAIAAGRSLERYQRELRARGLRSWWAKVADMD